MTIAFRRGFGTASVTLLLAVFWGIVACVPVSVAAGSPTRVQRCASVNFNDGAMAIDVQAVSASCRVAHEIASGPRSGREGVYHIDGYICASGALEQDTALTICIQGIHRVSWENRV